jgi:hypothetical protein
VKKVKEQVKRINQSTFRMQLQVHAVSGRKHILEVEQNWTIAAIKEDLQ